MLVYDIMLDFSDKLNWILQESALTSNDKVHSKTIFANIKSVEKLNHELDINSNTVINLNLYMSSVNKRTFKILSTYLYLEKLHLGCTNTTDDLLKNITSLSNLITLHVNNTNITDDSIKYLTLIKSLRQLSLSDDNITDDGLKYMPLMRSLRQLSLDGTDITDDGLRYLVPLQLSYLGIPYNIISDKCIKYIKKMNLSDLSLNYRGAGQISLADKVREQLPNVNVL